MRQQIITFAKALNLEALIWITALVFLALNSPGCNHFTLCPIKNLGFTFCPGCGLGQSISYLFRLDFINSFHSHPLGFFAFIILLNRIRILLFKSYHHYQYYASKIKGEKTYG